MSEIKLLYVTLKIIELLVFIISGYKLWKLKSDKNYWKIAIFPIITYAIVEGLRFGRLVDWNLYYLRYISISNDYNSEDYEPLFKTIIYLFYNIGIPYYMFVCLQTTFLITSIFILIKKYRQVILFIVPLILFETFANEQLIRWYLGFSLILLSIHEMIEGNKIKTYIYLYCSTLIHVGFWIFLPIIFFSQYINKYTLPPYISLVLFFITSFLANLQDVMFISSITENVLSANLGLNEKVSYYLNATEGLLSGEWGNLGIMDMSLLSKIRYFLAYAPAVFFARNYLKNYSYGIFFYNIFVVGVIFCPLFTLIEIFDRIIRVFTFFSIIVNGIFFFEIVKNRKYVVKSILFLVYLSFLSNMYPNIANPLSRSDERTMLFIWNANGREYISNFGL